MLLQALQQGVAMRKFEVAYLLITDGTMLSSWKFEMAKLPAYHSPAVHRLKWPTYLPTTDAPTGTPYSKLKVFPEEG